MAVNVQLHGLVEAFAHMRTAFIARGEGAAAAGEARESVQAGDGGRVQANGAEQRADEEGEEVVDTATGEWPSPLHRLQRLSEPSSSDSEAVDEEEADEDGDGEGALGQQPQHSQHGQQRRPLRRQPSAQVQLTSDSSRSSTQRPTQRRWDSQADGGTGRGKKRKPQPAVREGTGGDEEEDDEEEEEERLESGQGERGEVEEEEEEEGSSRASLFPRLLVDGSATRGSRVLVREEGGKEALTRHFLHHRRPASADETAPPVGQLRAATDFAMEGANGFSPVHRVGSTSAPPQPRSALECAPNPPAPAQPPPSAGGTSLYSFSSGPSLPAAALPPCSLIAAPLFASELPPGSAPPLPPPAAAGAVQLAVSDMQLALTTALLNPSAAAGRSVVVLMTAVDKETVASLKGQVEALGGVVVNRFSPSVTHVLSPLACSPHFPLHTRLTKRTSKFLLAILAGVWVVDVDWVKESQLEGCWCTEMPFEVQGDLVLGAARGPTRGREARLARSLLASSQDAAPLLPTPSVTSSSISAAPLPRLLSSLVLLWLSPMSSLEPSYDVLDQLAELGGAQLRPTVDCERMQSQEHVQQTAAQLRALHQQLQVEESSVAQPRHALLLCRPDLLDFLATARDDADPAAEAAARCRSLLSDLLPLLLHEDRRLSLVNIRWLLDSVSSYSLRHWRGNRRYDAALDCNALLQQQTTYTAPQA